MTKHLVYQGPVKRNARKDFPIENLFSVVLSELDRQFVANGPAKSVDDMVERFRAACQLQTDKGFIENTVRGMPGQMKKLIEKEGGPTGK